MPAADQATHGDCGRHAEDLVRVAHERDSGEDPTERDGEETGPEPVELGGLAARVPAGAGGPGDCQSADADRDVDVEDPAPRRRNGGHERPAGDAHVGQGGFGVDRLQYGRTDERPGGHAQERQRADDAQGPRPRRALEQVRGGGGGHWDDRAATDRLDEPGGDQLVEVLGDARQERPEGEDGKGGEEEPAGAPQVGQAAGQRHRHHVDQQVAVDDPGRLAQIRPVGHRGQDLWQGHGRDHQLEAGQEDADAEDPQHQVRVASAHGPECMRHGRPLGTARLNRGRPLRRIRHRAAPSRHSPAHPRATRPAHIAAATRSLQPSIRTSPNRSDRAHRRGPP